MTDTTSNSNPLRSHAPDVKRPTVGKLVSRMVRLLFSLPIAVGLIMPQNVAYADVRDVNRTAGDTVDTVMRPAPAPEPAKEEKKILRCGVVMTILICW
jgi:hypothetical protein